MSLQSKWCNFPQASSLEPLLAKRCTHMQEDPEISQRQTQNRQSKTIGQRKPGGNAPKKWFKLSQGQDSPLAHLCLSTHTVLFLLVNTSLTSLIPVSIWKLPADYPADGPEPCHWPLSLACSGQHSAFSLLLPTSGSGQEPKPCFKPLQAEATYDRQ